MGIKEQVKSGKLAPEDAIKMVDSSCVTYGWLKRRKYGNPVVVSAPVKSKAKKHVSKKAVQPEDVKK
jgi:hypothetical protein